MRLIVSDVESKVSCLRIEPRNYVDRIVVDDPEAPTGIIRLAAYPVDIPFTDEDGLHYYIGTGGDDKSSLSLSDTSSPGTVDMTGVLGIGGIDRDLILMKYFEGAKVYFFASCWNNFVEDEEPYGIYIWGKTTLDDDTFTVELTHMSDLLKSDVSQSYTKLCTNIFKDTIIDQRGTTPIPGIGRCDPDGEALLSFVPVDGYITQVIDTKTFRDNTRTEAEDWFGNGQVTFNEDDITHRRDQRVFEVSQYSSDGTFYLLEPPVLGALQVGMYYKAMVGCRKRFTEDCKGKFNNARNFFGFEYIPLPSQSGQSGPMNG